MPDKSRPPLELIGNEPKECDRVVGGRKLALSRPWLYRFLHWSNFWFHIGLWIWAGLLWVLKWWFPAAFRPVELSGGIVTGLATFYLMHYFIIVSESRTFRRICIPLVGLIDIFTIGGIIALIFNPK